MRARSSNQRTPGEGSESQSQPQSAWLLWSHPRIPSTGAFSNTREPMRARGRAARRPSRPGAAFEEKLSKESRWGLGAAPPRLRQVSSTADPAIHGSRVGKWGGHRVSSAPARGDAGVGAGDGGGRAQGQRPPGSFPAVLQNDVVVTSGKRWAPLAPDLTPGRSGCGPVCLLE